MPAPRSGLCPATRYASLALSILAAASLAACGSSSKPATSSTSGSRASSTPAATTSASGCQSVSAPAPKGPQHLAKPTAGLDPARSYTVKLTTSCGEIDIRLDVKRAPRTAASFVALVKRGFFDGLTFHRIVPGFVIQGGDPEGTGSGGPGYTVVERPPSSLRYSSGVVAMAKTSTEPAGASGSQFFIVTGNAPLPPEYALLGTVVGGMDVATRIDQIPADPNSGQPSTPVVIRRAVLQVR